MSEWEIIPIGELCHAIYDGPHATPKKVESGPIFLGISNLSNGRIDLSNTEYLSESDFVQWTKRVTPKENDIVFSYETRLGEAALVPHGIKCCLGRRMALMRPDLSKVDPQFLLYAYLSPNFQGTIQSRTIYGSTVNRIALTEFPSYPIKIPPLSIQKEISSLLGNLDRKIENLRKQNETLERIAQTLFKHWFVDFEFPNDEGKPYKSSGGEMVRSELGEIPVGWRVGKLEDFGKVVTGKTPSTKNPIYWGKGLPFITPTDFKNYGKFVLNSEREISKMAVLEFKNLVIPEKSVVVTCIGSDMGKVARTATRCITNQQLNSLVFNQIKNGIEYVYQFLVSQYKMLRLIALGGSTMPIINKTAFSNIEIVIPDLLTLDKFNETVESFNLKVINNEQQIQTLYKTRDVLLPKLMSGKLRINQQLL